MSQAFLALVCPSCSNPLEENAARLCCAACRQAWPVVEGIPHFVQEFPYWGEMPFECMTDVLERCQREHYRDVLQQHPDPKVREAALMILNLDRANWHFLVDLPAASHVLDIGAGSGTVSHALAKRFAQVTAVEPVIERVRFMQTRFRQEGFSNISILRSSIWALPFSPASADLIVLNGVLEWVAEGSTGNPALIQQQALKRVFQLLRPDGYLYLGIENRLQLGYFLGYKDPHCRLPFVTILPRPLAHWYARRNGMNGYRNYLYSYWGYQKLLRRTGFTRIETYIALPTYNHPRYLVPVEEPIYSYFSDTFLDPPARLSKRLIASILANLGLTRYLQYSYIFLARK